MAQYGAEVYHNYDMPHQFEKKGIAKAKTMTEAQRETKIIRETDVIVVGGGPGGIAAAVSAARGGAKTILIERYGHLGGMSTGGLVNIIPNLSDIYGTQHIGGFCQEVIDRLAARGAACFPEKCFWGKSESSVVDTYLKANMMHFYIRKNKEGKYVVLYTAVIDPEVAKDEMNTMLSEAGAELLLHTWVTAPIMDGNTVKGVIVESKAGRQALLGKVVIDCSGDGDLLPGTGAETTDYMIPGSRIAQFGFVYWIANVDLEKYDDFMNTAPEQYKEATQAIVKAGGLPHFSRGLLKQHEGVVWVHRLIGSLHQTEPEEMTHIDVTTRNQSVRTWELLRKYMPGFEKSFIMLTAPQLGTSGGRRIVGEYFLTGRDMDTDQPFDDTIAVFADNDRGEASLLHPKTYIPYRALVPKETEGLLVACRAFSADHDFSEFFNLIPHCMCFGQAAGAAAAIAVKDGVGVRHVSFTALRSELLTHGAILP
ncbi:FAD dependent oxidoreductase [Sporobacter termitidis DSM 10068]|uniref:FAD dependent oxidoreductase n=1 Tax=Sporobacter termitidis DSM 10068 TaxID=1123282 RepID=A0A1M5Z399_9FIRM|nr:FAD-dependent oxidoreductase [Sporobacter termitidis]SHI18732.1 FAD dependent oxidoreductase [Sporobacter termitidis DSM 10068]